MSIEAVWLPGDVVIWRGWFRTKTSPLPIPPTPVGSYTDALRAQTVGLERVVDALLCKLAEEDGSDLHGLNGTRRHAQ